MRKLAPILIAAVCLCGCPDSDNNGADAGTEDDAGFDVGTDVSAEPDEGTFEDAASDVASSDAALDVSLDVSLDSGTDAAADAATDAADETDAGADPFEGRPPGQCTENADCPVGPQGSMCSRALPGGACLGCGDDGDCPDGPDWSSSCSDFGVCITDCSVDDDCPPGTECGPSGCGAIDCVNDVCPVELFGCSDSGRCARIDCTEDPTVCPDGTTCTDDLCIEDRAN